MYLRKGFEMTTRATLHEHAPNPSLPDASLARHPISRSGLTINIQRLADAARSLVTRFIVAEHQCVIPQQPGTEWRALDSLDVACSSGDFVCPECGGHWRRVDT